jgi:Dihydrouridine synthase (Dus)
MKPPFPVSAVLQLIWSWGDCRYSKLADWQYIKRCAAGVPEVRLWSAADSSAAQKRGSWQPAQTLKRAWRHLKHRCCVAVYLHTSHSLAKAPPLQGFQVLGNGDVYNFEQWESQLGGDSRLAALMIGRAALIKPWIFTEIKV